MVNIICLRMIGRLKMNGMSPENGTIEDDAKLPTKRPTSNFNDTIKS
jgi:hypothetical protein